VLPPRLCAAFVISALACSSSPASTPDSGASLPDSGAGLVDGAMPPVPDAGEDRTGDVASGDTQAAMDGAQMRDGESGGDARPSPDLELPDAAAGALVRFTWSKQAGACMAAPCGAVVEVDGDGTLRIATNSPFRSGMLGSSDFAEFKAFIIDPSAVKELRDGMGCGGPVNKPTTTVDLVIGGAAPIHRVTDNCTGPFYMRLEDWIGRLQRALDMDASAGG